MQNNKLKFYLNKIKTIDGSYPLYVAENMCNSFLYSEFLLSHYNLISEYFPQNSKNILDVGCGAGPFEIFFAKRDWNIIGIDLNPIAIECCKRNIKKYNLEDKVKIKCKNISNFKYDKKFDIIITNPPYGTSSYMRDNLIDNRFEIYEKIKKGIFDAEVDDFLTNCWCDENGKDMLDYIFDRRTELLKENGMVLIVCGDDFVDSKEYMINKASKYNFILVHSLAKNKHICIIDNGEKFETTKKINILLFRYNS